MSLVFVTPDSNSVTKLLEMMYDGLKTSDAAVGDVAGQYVATFLSDDDQLVALCACDGAFVAYAGTAIAMIPPDVANEMLADNDISEAVIENFYEVMNISSKLLMSETSSHLRLDRLLPPSEAAAAVAALEAANSAAFELDVPRYGKGKMTFLIA